MNTELNTHNNTRLIEVDVAKAFAIIYMVVDHVYERMSVLYYTVRNHRNFCCPKLNYNHGFGQQIYTLMNKSSKST